MHNRKVISQFTAAYRQEVRGLYLFCQIVASELYFPLPDNQNVVMDYIFKLGLQNFPLFAKFDFIAGIIYLI